MSKVLEKIRVKSNQIRTPSSMDEPDKGVPYNEKDKVKELRIKHIDCPSIFTETSPLYHLVITDYDDKDYRVLSYTKKNNSLVLFQDKLGLISKKAVNMLIISNV